MEANFTTMDYNNSNQYTFLIIVGIIALFFILIAFVINSVIPFLREREYIVMEMRRSNDEANRQHWRKELRRLYLGAIPIVGRFFW